MTDDNDVYTPAQYREHVDGYGQREPVEHPHTGLTRDWMVSRYLSILAENYDPREAEDPGAMPGTVDGLQEWQEIVATEATETGRRAMKNGDMPTLKNLTGDQNQRADISGMKAIQKVDQIITDPAPVIVIIGDMGAGKSQLATLLGQRASHLLDVDRVASNIPTLKETDEWTDQDGQQRDGFVGDWSSLQEWVKQDGDPLENEQQRKLYIGDEFSTGGSGTGKDGFMMRQKMGPLVFKIRKYNGLLIYIGHDESSVHPLLWRVGYVIKKVSEKQAIIADRIKNGELRDIQDRIDGIPLSDWRFETNDPAVWSWTEDDEEQPDPGSVAYDTAVYTAIKSKDQGLSSRKVEPFIPFSHKWVNDRRNEFFEDGEHQELLSRVEQWTDGQRGGVSV